MPNIQKFDRQRFERYPKPACPYIGDAEEKLYKLEETRSKAIKAAAEEHGRILGHTPEQFWTHSMAEQLYSVLESFDRPCSLRAAQAYLEAYGFTVSLPPSDVQGAA